MCCGQWVSFPSVAQIAVLPPQALQLQLFAKGPRGYIKKTSSHAEKVCREDSGGEISPKGGKSVGIQEGNCQLPDWQELKLSSLEDFPAPN